MCQSLIYREKLNERKVESNKEWKSLIRRVFQDLVYLLRPEKGVLAVFLEENECLNSRIISQSKERLPLCVVLRINLFREVLQLVNMVYQFSK